MFGWTEEMSDTESSGGLYIGEENNHRGLYGTLHQKR